MKKIDDRIHLARRPFAGFHGDEVAQEIEFKPSGLWYGFGSSWIDWCRENMPEHLGDSAYRLRVAEGRILVLHPDDLGGFTEEYGTAAIDSSITEKRTGFIDWPAVAESYDGVEIPLYSWKHRLELMWYYGWDCASGCIWRARALHGFELLNQEALR